MSLPHQALHDVATELRAQLPGSSSLKLIGAFAGGAACAGLAVAAWTSSLTTTSPDQPQQRAQYAAAPSPVASDATALQPVESQAGKTGPAEGAKTESEPSAATAGADIADRACDNQVWPYIEQRCLIEAKPDASSSRRVRIVSTDANVASDWTPQPPPAASLNAASAGASGDATHAPLPSADQAVSIPLPPTDPRRIAGATVPNAAGTASSETTGAVQPAVAVAEAAPREEDPLARRRNARSAEAADRRRQRRADRLAQRRHGDGDDARLLPRRTDDADNDDDRAQPRQGGRQVTVEQTYRLPDGRRVLVRRVYQNMPEGGLRNFDGGRPLARPSALAPSGWVANN